MKKIVVRKLEAVKVTCRCCYCCCCCVHPN
jgi:hypothetical protein